MAPDPSSVYEDDETIPDDEKLYRLILPTNTVLDGNGIAVRGATNAFQDYPADRLEAAGVPAVAVSVFLESELLACGTTVEDVLARREGPYGMATITAGDARAENQGVMRWPTEQDPEHAMVFCLSGSRKSNGASKRLAKVSKVVAAPPSQEF